MSSPTDAIEAFDFQAYYAFRDRSIGRMMWRLKRYMHIFVEPRLEASGFHNFKWSYMLVLSNAQEDGITTTELARRTGTTKQAMSKTVKVMEEEGYVYMRTHAKDGRSSIIFLNQRGKELLICLHHAMTALKEKFAQLIGTEEVDRMAATMQHLVEALEREGPPKWNANDLEGC